MRRGRGLRPSSPDFGPCSSVADTVAFSFHHRSTSELPRMETTPMQTSDPKAVAGLRAAQFVESGMIVGLGTGSTVHFTIQELGRRVREEGLAIRGVPTSLDTENKARALDIPLTSLDEVSRIDVTIDGADEIDEHFDMIKGGGGALLREKVVAAASKRVVIVVGANKVVSRLGTTFALPVEVVPFARGPVRRALVALGCEVTLRSRQGRAVTTDNGNEIFDCRFASGIAEAGRMERAIDAIPGVVESGLFVQLAHTCVVGRADGTCDVRHRS